jgi:hypothetical protein
MPDKPTRINITSRSYAALANQPIFITPELRKALQKRKLRDGSTAYTTLLRMGFRGGKHLIELIRGELRRM